MKEFMLLVRNVGDQKALLSKEQHHAFVKKCEVYIDKLKNEGKLIAAQPLVREGKVITGSEGSWKESSFDSAKEIQVGYYHIYAKDIGEAVFIAKGNPEFEYNMSASIEVRPIKTKEGDTGFTYPKAG